MNDKAIEGKEPLCLCAVCYDEYRVPGMRVLGAGRRTDSHRSQPAMKILILVGALPVTVAVIVLSTH